MNVRCGLRRDLQQVNATKIEGEVCVVATCHAVKTSAGVDDDVQEFVNGDDVAAQ